MPKPSARDRILDAYENILLEAGPAAVTLEAVAGRAGVSKGGLLYHFGSKDALLDGLLGRLAAFAEEDVAKTKAAPEGPVRYYLHTSVTDAEMDNPWHRTMLAALRLMPDEARVADALRECQQPYRDLLADQVADPLTAELVALVGDGLYLRASMGEDTKHLLAQLDEILTRLGHTPNPRVGP